MIMIHLKTVFQLRESNTDGELKEPNRIWNRDRTQHAYVGNNFESRASLLKYLEDLVNNQNFSVNEFNGLVIVEVIEEK